MKSFYFTAFCLFLFSIKGYGQSKNALIIGINDYYFKENVKSNQSLSGCVNDAKSIKELIISHFGFPQKNIKELYNAQATQKNILGEMMNLLARCNAGDNAFIFYSGHGILLDNSFTNEHKNQAIVPTDIFQKYKSYILNQDLAAIFNKFIDKKITLTVIFDCCYSWSVEYLRQGIWETFEEEDARERWMPYQSYEPYYSFLSDTLYQYDSLSAKYYPVLVTVATPDSVLDQLYEFNAADSTYHISLLGSFRDVKFIPNEGEDIKTKKIIQEIPSKRPNSNFLFLSGTNGRQKGLEKSDLNRNRHGVFTRALIDVLNKNPAGISSSDVFEKVKSQLSRQFIYSQTPNMVGEADRMKDNLFAVNNQDIKDGLQATCIGVKDKKIILNKGAAAGLAVGNILKDINNPSVSVVVSALKDDETCVATIKTTGNPMRATFFPVSVGHQFKVTDWFTKSQPLIRVYIPNDSVTFLQMNDIFKKYVQSLDSTDIHFLAFEEDKFPCSKIYIKGNSFTHRYKEKEYTAPLKDFNISAIHKVNDEVDYFIYLPVPTELSVAVKNKCMKDQNIQLVDDPMKAEISFYCAYSKEKKTPIFVCSRETTGEYRIGKYELNHARSNYYVTDKNSTEVIANSIYKLLLEFASKKSWLNYYSKK